MRHLLDINIFSNIIKPVPSEALVEWMAEQVDEDLFIASLTVAEIWRGVLENPQESGATNFMRGSPSRKDPQRPFGNGQGRRKMRLWRIFRTDTQALVADRIVPFDEKAALIWARLMADGKAKGHPRNALDTIIAAVAEAR